MEVHCRYLTRERWLTKEKIVVDDCESCLIGIDGFDLLEQSRHDRLLARRIEMNPVERTSRREDSYCPMGTEMIGEMK